MYVRTYVRTYVCMYVCMYVEAWPQLPALPASNPTCRNVSLEGRTCGHACDRDGKHAERCAPGGGLTARHDSILHCLQDLCKRGMNPRPRKEQVLPVLAGTVTGQIGQSRMDLVAQDGTAKLLIDVTIVSPYAGDRSFTGYAARRAAMAKRTKYEDDDLLPFALVTGGRLRTDARAMVKRPSQHAEIPTVEAAYI